MNRGRELMVGSVILAAIAVAVIGSLWLQGVSWGRLSIPVEVLVRDVAQLTEGNAVKFRGVRIGEVQGVEVEPSGQAVRVFLELQEDVVLPVDAAVIVAPESFFGDWQAEIVSRDRYPRYDFFTVAASELGKDTVVLGGYAIPEISRLTASAEQISDNLATLSDRMEAAFSEETALNLSTAVDNIEALTTELRNFVQTQSNAATDLSGSATSALSEVEEASRIARASFQRIEQLLTDGRVDSLMMNADVAAQSVRRLTEDLSGSSDELASAVVKADSVFTQLNALTTALANGEGSIGRLLTDPTLALQAEEILTELTLLLEDMRANPQRYVRLSIF